MGQLSLALENLPLPPTLDSCLCGLADVPKGLVGLCCLLAGATMGWPAGSPSLQQLLDFLQCLVDGSGSDRGKARRRSALNVLSAMTFAAHKLSLCKLLALLEQQVVMAWKQGDQWNRTRTKEAAPLPFDVVRSMEAALSCAPDEDCWFLCALLVMVWASLRWSDLQRLDLSSVRESCDAVCGWCWRTKSSKSGMPWSFLRSGFLQSDWGLTVINGIKGIRGQHPEQDFFLRHNGRPMRYAVALSQFRRCLVSYGGLPNSMAADFSLHSLKASMLSWAGALGVDAHDRSHQGHHRSVNLSGCVAKYSRDDVTPQLRCQRAVVRAVESGWIPGTPLDRGVSAIMSGSAGCNSPTEMSEEDGELSDSSSEVISDSDAESSSCCSVDSASPDAGSICADVEAATVIGPWLVNYVSGVVHRAVRHDGGVHPACRPAAKLHSGYEEWTSNPLLLGFRACLHSGCKVSLAQEP